jgi:polyhydroxyalkanoate synthesis regulator phasin
MKIVSLIAAEGERVQSAMQARFEADIATALEVIEEDLDAMQAKILQSKSEIDRLRTEVDALKTTLNPPPV